MANLKEVRERIASVKNTSQITSAMKMVSAAKLRKAQSAIQDMRPYADKMGEMLRNILSNLDGSVELSYGKERPVESACMVVVTSSRGLCGAFNSNILKAAVRTIEEQYADVRAAGKLSIMCIGKKGYDFFKKRYRDCEIISDYVELFNDLRFDQVAPVASRLMEAFENGTYDHISIAYAHFRNAALQYPQTETFLPVPKMEVADDEQESSKKRADYIFEPEQEALLEHLIPSILRMNFHKYMLDTHASEHGARMTAMDKATENADELLRELRISYNKARQEAITKELSEIVGGAAALEG